MSEKLKQFQTCISVGLFYNPKCRHYFPRNFRYMKRLQRAFHYKVPGN